MHIFKLSGEYIGFIKESAFYSASGEYRGWLEDGHVWDKDGHYRGKVTLLNGNHYILKDTLVLEPSQRAPREMSPTEQIQPAKDVPPVTTNFNLIDGSNGS